MGFDRNHTLKRLKKAPTTVQEYTEAVRTSGARRWATRFT